MNISKRLRTIASLVSNGSFILDVGCDHAYLSIYLNIYKNAKVIASDLRVEPLKIAQKNILKYEADVTLRQEDGIGNADNVDTIIISGMGSKTIIDIIDKDKDKLDKKTFILSSNNDYDLIRKYMNSIGYKIIEEKIIKDNNKYYEIIKYQQGREKLNDLDIKYGPILRKEKSKVFIEYQNYMINKLTNILNKISIDNKRYQEISKEIIERKNVQNN